MFVTEIRHDITGITIISDNKDIPISLLSSFHCIGLVGGEIAVFDNILRSQRLPNYFATATQTEQQPETNSY